MVIRMCCRLHSQAQDRDAGSFSRSPSSEDSESGSLRLHVCQWQQFWLDQWQVVTCTSAIPDQSPWQYACSGSPHWQDLETRLPVPVRRQVECPDQYEKHRYQQRLRNLVNAAVQCWLLLR